MKKKTILTTLLFSLPLAFLEQTKPEVSPLVRNKSINRLLFKKALLSKVFN